MNEIIVREQLTMSGKVPQLVVVGCPSMDRLIVGGVEVEAPGGAGFYTALAARRGGVTVGLVGAVPTHLPRAIAAAFGPGGIDRSGIQVREGVLPSFHISYDEAQDADYLAVELGVETQLGADDFPDAWLTAEYVHISPLGMSAKPQLDFVRRLRERGFDGHISAGCHLDIDSGDRETALELISECSLVFLNRSEADALYPQGPPVDDGVRRCVTEGSEGVTVVGDGSVVRTQSNRVELVDPTGAGDAFSGGYLSGFIRGSEAVASGQDAAETVIGGWGTSALVEAVAAKVEGRVEVDFERTTQVAGLLANVAKASRNDFCGYPFPEQGAPLALDCLALATAHQYGFWYSDVRGWVEPMYAYGDGRRFKGSDFIWQAFTRAVGIDPTVLDPQRLASEPDLFEEICRADDGSCPIPVIASHQKLQMAFGSALIDGGYSSFEDLVADANDAARPGHAFLERLAHFPGYSEDSLAKKANLLLIILSNRPEKFLDLSDPESVTPIVDYHLLRSCLRTGCITIVDPELRIRVEQRRWVDEAEEAEIRQAAHDAINLLVDGSGLDQAAIDGFFFANGRKICVETSEPDCTVCPVESVCSKRHGLFQPVIRTTAY